MVKNKKNIVKVVAWGMENLEKRFKRRLSEWMNILVF